MTITSTCGGCGKTLAVADEYAGRQARCPQCGQIYTVPSASTTSPSSPVGGADTYPAGAFAGDTLPTGNNSSALDAGQPLNMGSTAADQYWMKANTGQEYGPVDSTTLGRWFSEGRIGPGYQVRVGATGSWQPASNFQSVAPTSTNPFAAQPMGGMMPQMGRSYPKSDQSGVVLALGILSWFTCPICGIIAWVMGAQALKDIQMGLSDPTNRGLVQVGYYLGMVHVILFAVCMVGYVGFIAMAVIAGNM